MENTKKSFGEIWAELTTEQREYLKGYINRQRQDAVKQYQAETTPNQKQLPTDEEIIKKSEVQYLKSSELEMFAFEQGAKWMREQLT